MTVAWVPVLCSKLGDQAPRSGLTWSAGLLEPGDEVVASKDEEVGGLAIFSAFSHSTFPLPGCVGLGHGGATSPVT